MNIKLAAPEIDRLIHAYDRFQNPEQPSKALMEAMDPLYAVLADLAPYEENDEAKGIWLMVPRGEITDWSSFEDAKEYDEVETFDEYEKRWKEEYPQEIAWYRLVISENKPDSHLRFRGISVGRNIIVNADLRDGVREETWFREEPAIQLMPLLTESARKSMEMLRAGTYNETVDRSLPYWHRTGVIKRSVLYAAEPEYRERELDGLDAEKIQKFRELITSGANDEMKIGRLQSFTANDFFRACALGYQACGYETKDCSPSDLYLKHADGRDEGLTGTGHGLNEGPGIDFDDPDAWDHWYFSSRGGGHPWEVVPGGNSTHMDLFVCHDRHELEWMVRSGRITQEEADKHPCGYYFEVSGKHRPMESVNFYLALHDAGLPVLLRDAEEILARFEGSDYVGIVPRDVTPRYCEEMFPKEYGRVIDFMHVYDEDLEQYGDQIIWLPEDPEKLITASNEV